MDVSSMSQIRHKKSYLAFLLLSKKDFTRNGRNKMDLLKDNLKKIYLRFLIPSLGSAMVMSIYTLTDAIVIGKGVGADALAALSLTTPLLCILMSMGILFGVGGSVQMSVCRGTGNTEKANRYFTLSFAVLLGVAMILWLIYGTGMPVLLRLMGGNDILYPYAMAYMRYIIIFLPVAVFSNYMAIFVRADGDPNRAMAGVLLGGAVNIVLDLVFVFLLQMGIGGAALASVIGMVIQVMVGATHFLSRRNGLKFIKPKHVSSSIIQIIGNGIPSFFNEFANGFIVLLFNIQILKYCGDAALSVYSVISNCVILFNSLFTGVGQSIQPVIATNFGAGMRERIKKIKNMAFATILVMGTIFSASGILFPNGIGSIFMEMDEEMSAIARSGLRMYFAAFLPMGINLLSSYYLQSILCVKRSLCISLLRNVFLSSVAILIFPVLFGGNSLWLVMPIVEWIVLVCSVVFVKNQDC